MKPIDLKSVLIAAAIASLLGWAYKHYIDANAPNSEGLIEGAFIGAGVQIGVRLLGVS